VAGGVAHVSPTPLAGKTPSLPRVDAVVFASRTGVRLELTPVPAPPGAGPATMPVWQARVGGDGLDASMTCPEAGWEPQSLAGFLRSLDEDWRGWDGERLWQSEGAELRLAARHDKTNTVLIEVVLEDGAPPRWRCEAELELDPGVFRQLAADARRLGEASASASAPS
jgi:hypothetical protein